MVEDFFVAGGCEADRGGGVAAPAASKRLKNNNDKAVFCWFDMMQIYPQQSVLPPN